MKKQGFANDTQHYLPLIGIFTAGILAFVVFSYDREFQVGIALSLTVAHVTWGIVHHIVHKNLSVLIVLEYIAISLLGLTVMLSLILRA